MSSAKSVDTKASLVEAGIELLRQLTAADIVSAVGTREIARRAGVSGATFFHHFGSVELYTEELLKEIYSSARLPRGERVRRDLDSVAIDALPVSALLTTYRNALITNLGDPEYRLKHGLWWLGGDSVDSHYHGYLDEVDTSIAIGANHMLKSWGREPRPPFDLAALIAVGNALAHGAYVRHTLDAELFSIERFALSVTSTVLVGVRLAGDDRTMADRLAEMNYYPRDISPKERVPTSSDGSNKERLLRAAAELFAEYGVEATSVAQLAKRADVSSSTLFNLFGSKSRLAVALFEHHVELQAAGRMGLFDQEDAVLDYVMGVADLAGSHPDLARIFLTEFVADESGVVGTVFVEPLVDLLSSSGRATASDPNGDLRDLAQLMVIVAMQRTLHRPALGVTSAANWAMQLLLLDTND
jgi:AcrR family transcriptional regulator